MTAATTPQAAFGTTVTWAGHDIGYLLDCDYSGLSIGTIEFASHESAYKTYKGGLIDGGELTLPVQFITGDTTGQKYLLADAKTKTERQVIITFPDATTWTFNAIVTKYGDFTMPREGELLATIVLKISGEPTFSEE